MKRAITILLILCMLLPLAACGKNVFPSSKQSDPAAAAPETTFEPVPVPAETPEPEPTPYSPTPDQAMADAEGGDVEAMVWLGDLYAVGKYKLGIKRDFALARQWYQRAAEAGDLDAMVKLAKMLMNGTGGEPDNNAGILWYEKAADAGSLDAMAALSRYGYTFEELADNPDYAPGSPKGGMRQLTGTLGAREYVSNESAMPLYLDNQVIDCDSITATMRITDYTGYPFGTYGLFTMDLNGWWVFQQYFKIDKSMADGRPKTFTFNLYRPTSFQAIAIALAEDGMEFDLWHDTKFSVKSECVSPTAASPKFTPAGEEYAELFAHTFGRQGGSGYYAPEDGAGR